MIRALTVICKVRVPFSAHGSWARFAGCAARGTQPPETRVRPDQFMTLKLLDKP